MTSPDQTNNVSVSFEFFPPKTEKAEETLWKAVTKLAPLDPAFVSMTYGAGGTTQDVSRAIVERLCKETDLNVAAHLTCVGASKNQVNAVAEDFLNLGANQIVALRGDPPVGTEKYTPHPDGYENAADLVRGLRGLNTDPFEISVGAYPEIHPDSNDEAADLDNLKKKVDAGADRALTQFFFDNDAFLRFRDKAAGAGISVPIVPGIMPIMNFNGIRSMSEKVGTSIPHWLEDYFSGLEEDMETRRLVAMNIAADQVMELKREGVNDFHFYTMNRGELTFALCHLLGVRPKAEHKLEKAS